MSTDLASLKILVDVYQQTRIRRLAMEKEAEKVHDKEKEYAEQILTVLRDSASPVMGGSTHLCTRKVTNEPTVEDWDVLHAHIKETDEWDLMQKRVGVAAVKLRWDEGEEVPGVGSFPVEKLGLTKLPEGA
jgi:hypothetical protein